MEGIACRLADKLTRNAELDPAQKAKVEYGISLLLGILIELILTSGISFFVGTFLYTIVMMLSALFLRVFMGGTHCSSYRRCLVFTMVVFIGLSIPVKAIILNIGVSWYGYFIPMLAGITIQVLMASSIGNTVILKSDRVMQKIGI